MNTLHSLAGIGDILVNAIERHAGAVAIVEGDRTITYGQLGRDVAHAIQAFHELGARPGDRISQISGNRYEMVVVILACYVGGFISVPLAYNGEVAEHAFAVDDSTPCLLVIEEALKTRADALAGICMHRFLRMTHEDLARRCASQAVPTPLPSGQADGTACARMVYTGGTTGRPKGVMNSASALAFACLLLAHAHDLSAETAFLLCAPISHGAGSFVAPVLSKGGRLVIHRGFDAEAFIAAMRSGQANSALLVPTMVYVVLDHPMSHALEKGAMRRLVYGAAPMSPGRLREALDRFGFVLAQSYGQTEVPSAIMYLAPEDHRAGDARLSSAGKPYPGVQVRLMVDGKPLAPRSREVGEVCVRAPHVMMGYWNQPELTAKAIEDGWLHTGDLAYEDEDGYYYIVDRLKDLVISGGFNIYPSEVEAALEQHPAVQATALVAIPDDKWGEAAHAFVVLRDGAKVSGDELRALVRNRLGPVKTPKSIAFIPALPLTKVGKVDKKALRAPFWTDTDRNVH